MRESGGFGTVNISGVHFDIDNRRPIECVQPSHFQDTFFHFKKIDHTERYGVRAVR